jgi:ketosteroid isomerase-like protein
MFRAYALLTISLSVALSLFGCAKKGGEDAESAVQEFFAAINAGDYQKAADHYGDKAVFLEGSAGNRPLSKDLSDLFPKGSIVEVKVYNQKEQSPEFLTMNVVVSTTVEGKKVDKVKRLLGLAKLKDTWVIRNTDLADGWEEVGNLNNYNIETIVNMLNEKDRPFGLGMTKPTKTAFVAPKSIKEMMDGYNISYQNLCCPVTGEEYIISPIDEHSFSLAVPQPEVYGFKSEYKFLVRPESKPKGLQWSLYSVLGDGMEQIKVALTPIIPGPELTVVSEKGVNLRSGPGTANSLVKTLLKDDKLKYLGIETTAEDAQWLKVQTTDGLEGWVCTGKFGELWVK